MSHRAAKIEIYKDQIQCISGMPYERFIRAPDKQILEIANKLPFKDLFELHYLIAKIIYLNSESTTEEDLLLTNIMDLLNTGDENGR